MVRSTVFFVAVALVLGFLVTRANAIAGETTSAGVCMKEGHKIVRERPIPLIDIVTVTQAGVGVFLMRTGPSRGSPIVSQRSSLGIGGWEWLGVGSWQLGIDVCQKPFGEIQKLARQVPPGVMLCSSL